MQRYGLTVRKRSAAILEFLQFYSEGGKHDPLFISNYVTINVLDRLARTPGVGDAQLFGRLDYSMRIWFDMNRLISLNLAPSDIIAAIQQQNVQAAVGRIGARPTSDATQFQLNVQTQGRLVTPEQFGNIVIRANPDGSVLRLSRHRAHRTRRGEHGHREPAERQPGGLHRPVIWRLAPMRCRPRRACRQRWTNWASAFRRA